MLNIWDVEDNTHCEMLQGISIMKNKQNAKSEKSLFFEKSLLINIPITKSSAEQMSLTCAQKFNELWLCQVKKKQTNQPTNQPTKIVQETKDFGSLSKGIHCECI